MNHPKNPPQLSQSRFIQSSFWSLKRLIRPVLGVMTLLTSAQSFAQQKPISVNAQSFRPALGPENIYTLEGSRTSGQWKPMVQGVVEWAYRPLRLVDRDNKNEIFATTIPNMLTLHVMAGLGFTNWFSLGFDLPVIMYQQFDSQTPSQDSIKAPAVAGVGDFRLIAKFRLLDNSKSGFGLAFVPQITFPAGQGTDFRGDDAVGFEPRFALDYRLKNGFFVAMNLSALLRTSNQEARNVTISHQMRYGLGLFIPLPASFGLAGELTGGTSLINGPTVYSPLETTFGVRWRHKTGLQVDVAGGAGLTSAPGIAQGRLLAGVGYLPMGDRIKSKPVEAPAPQQPKPDLDRDHDTVVDRLDHCPDVPGPVANQGCPWPDRDGDGVIDKKDNCPDVPGPVENQGCPWPDRDGDGVIDRDDKCPDEPGPKPTGCPPQFKYIVITKNKIELKRTVFYETGKAIIKPLSYPLLDEVADALKIYSDMKIRIEGHTDPRGSMQMNIRLSRARAVSVLEYLIKKGIAPSRMTSEGYGPTRPIASNKTKEGMAQNRRTDFFIVDTQSETPVTAPAPQAPAAKP